MKARIKFSKCGSMRFIGHLDVMRYFQKAFRRAHIPVSYSKGYSPHQILSFASPLGIGLTSDAEYMDMELEECPAPEQMVDWMNSQMNDEIRVKEFCLLSEQAKPSMAVLAGCDYLVARKPDATSTFWDSMDRAALLEQLLSREEILVIRKTKRSEKETDIRQNLYALAAEQTQFEAQTGQHYGALCLDLQLYQPLWFGQLTAGSIQNIKPELVIQALCNLAGEEYRPLDYQIHRLEMYADADARKGEIHLLHGDPPCRLVPLSQYEQIF